MKPQHMKQNIQSMGKTRKISQENSLRCSMHGLKIGRRVDEALGLREIAFE